MDWKLGLRIRKVSLSAFVNCCRRDMHTVMHERWTVLSIVLICELSREKQASHKRDRLQIECT